MATTINPPDDLSTIEAEAAEHLSAEALDAPIPEEPTAPDEHLPVTRYALAVAMTTLAAAIMVGGVFTGVSPRIYAAFAGFAGIGVGVLAFRSKKALAANAIILGGLFAIGLVCVVFTGPDNITKLNALVSEAASAGDLVRPPVPFLPGWAAIVGWLMAAVGFAAVWVATALKRPSLGLILPLPVVGIAAISVPKSAAVASGLVCMVLFAISLGVLSSAQNLGDDEQKVPLSYELRRAARSVPLLAGITAALFFLSQSNLLFPPPLIDPTQEPQKPKSIPLSEVEDRVLFEVSDTSITGPWRIGSLDVYDGNDWRLPPFSENELDAVPESGVVNSELTAGVKATFTIAGLGGAVLPGLPNMVGVVAQGPRLAYDERNANLRVDQGQIETGLVYTVTAAALPSIEMLQQLGTPTFPAEVRRFIEIPEPAPPAVQDLLREAEAKDNLWDQFDFLRQHVLSEVTAAGAGTPVSVPPERVQDMLAGTKEGTPYEIVAAQAMLARWAGVPSRIGYGFDQGEVIEGRTQVRPKHGATFLEVYFPGFGWLPVIGTPEKAKPTVGNEGQQQTNPNVLPSDDIQVQLYLPVVLPIGSLAGQQIVRTLAIALPILFLLTLAYLTWPIIKKALIRSRRRSRAINAGPRAQIATSYAEFRDFATDFGYRYDADTPLMFLDRLVDDAEHTELAWLVTRALFGDLRDELGPQDVTAAEELSRALRKRLAQAHPFTVRVVAQLSRLSVRHPYVADPHVSRKERRHAVEPAYA